MIYNRMVRFTICLAKRNMMQRYVFFVCFGENNKKNPAVTSGIFCKQFRRLMNYFFFLVSAFFASISWSFLLPFIKT